jgi:GNAT superfamily N-acetyltransferase
MLSPIRISGPAIFDDALHNIEAMDTGDRGFDQHILPRNSGGSRLKRGNQVELVMTVPSRDPALEGILDDVVAYIHATEYAKTVAIAVMGTDHRFARMHLGRSLIRAAAEELTLLAGAPPESVYLAAPDAAPYYEKLGFTFCHGMCMTLPLSAETQRRMQEWRPRLKPGFEMAQV